MLGLGAASLPFSGFVLAGAGVSTASIAFAALVPLAFFSMGNVVARVLGGSNKNKGGNILREEVSPNVGDGGLLTHSKSSRLSIEPQKQQSIRTQPASGVIDRAAAQLSGNQTGQQQPTQQATSNKATSQATEAARRGSNVSQQAGS